ncbi:MAG: zinc ribbon domain-containing protein [Candidatus Bathyarchaeota archaeon]|nr:zinc ribbon domain-containing protein [Candidatus Bathyarchaeota archaeon]
MVIAQINIPSEQILLIIIPFVAVVIVIILGEMLFRRRKKRLRQKQIMMRPQEVRPEPIEMPDTDTRKLEKLQTELENTSKQYLSGKISKQEFDTKVRTIEIQLMQYKTMGHIEEPLEAEPKTTEARPSPVEPIIIEPPTSKPEPIEPPPPEPSTEQPVSATTASPVTEPRPTEPPKRVCIHCKEEIPPDSIYCDRCGRYLGKPTT